MELQTKTLRLVLQTPEETLAWIEAMGPADRAEVSAGWLARVRAATVGDAWALGFIVIHRDRAAVVGGCGFKGPPDSEGVVEVAYGIDPGEQGKGYATEVAGALASYAFGDGRVCVVRAHTFEKANASARVLAKCGFGFAGQVMDPEDGLVWRWEKRRETVVESSAVPSALS